MVEGIKLDSHHRATLEKIFEHPTTHNLEWHDVLSLLEAVGTATETHKGRFRLSVGSTTIVMDLPKGHGHDLSDQQLVDLRHLLSGEGITPEALDQG